MPAVGSRLRLTRRGSSPWEMDCRILSGLGVGIWHSGLPSWRLQLCIITARESRGLQRRVPLRSILVFVDVNLNKQEELTLYHETLVICDSHYWADSTGCNCWYRFVHSRILGLELARSLFLCIPLRRRMYVWYIGRTQTTCYWLWPLS